ncbi:MAG: tRNA (cmo5U34)-methyltransferase [Methylococcaceae bacterium NSP1-1]|nr:MAG: tRNA (cmo5U34)-methyltransferase [Methylococcaceae bacterium NSP1-1]
MVIRILKISVNAKLENQRKREALENVLIPYRLDENYELLERAGFDRIGTYFQWFNFACMIAVKV